MYKVGDRVETYKEIRSLRGTGPGRVKGRIVEVYADTLTILFDESWPGGFRQLVFLTKDLLATDVLRLTVGDRVKTSDGRVGFVGLPRSVQPGPGYVSVLIGVHERGDYRLSDVAKVDDPDEGGQRWSFKSNKDTFDGARVIRELLNAGADYAVVAMDGMRVGLLHERLAARATALNIVCLAGHYWSLWQVERLSAKPPTHVRLSQEISENGYRWVDNVTLADLAAMVAELEKKEAEAKQFVTHVEWGKATRD